MESLYGTGGRLFSGWARAFVFSQIKNQISLKRIFNDYSDPFSRREKYLHGGYFFAYLMENHSLESVNKIFFHHKKHILFPIGMQSINRAFNKTFGENFQSLFEKYREFYLSKALNQKSSEAPSLLTSRITVPLNSDDKRIYFLISDGKTPPQLVILNKKTMELSKERRDMPLGKVFFIDNSFYSTGKGYTETMVSETSLFKEGYIPLKKYNSRYVMDIKKDKVISFDTSKGPTEFPLYVNGSFYDSIQSTALMDEEGNIYYFKQNKNIRTLYSNKIPLWSFEGYYSFPVDVDEEGVYFIGPTQYGSSLFLYSKDRVFRLSSSDTIVAGRKIHGNQFLVSEVGPQSYSYKIITTMEREELPYLYKYSFEKRLDFGLLPEEIHQIKQGVNQNQTAQEESFSADFLEETEEQDLAEDELKTELFFGLKDSLPEKNENLTVDPETETSSGLKDSLPEKNENLTVDLETESFSKFKEF